MRLEHYTAEPFAFDPNRVYTQRKPYAYGKPVGLWVSVAGEDDWPSWCQGEEFALNSLKHVAVVELHENANVELLSTLGEVFAFHNRYATEEEPPFRFGDSRHAADWRRSRLGVDWGKVATDFDGLLMTPYLWSCRLDGPSFYYGVDCASGCIWNLSAVKKVTNNNQRKEEHNG